MQFNCDGTQIVDAQGFQTFLDQNLMDDDEDNPVIDERRTEQRRHPLDQATRSHPQYGERRNPPGRREQDWVAIIGQEQT
jgi:hypothetical protein